MKTLTDVLWATFALGAALLVVGVAGIGWSRFRYAYRAIPGLVATALDEPGKDGGR